MSIKLRNFMSVPAPSAPMLLTPLEPKVSHSKSLSILYQNKHDIIVGLPYLDYNELQKVVQDNHNIVRTALIC